MRPRRIGDVAAATAAAATAEDAAAVVMGVATAADAETACATRAIRVQRPVRRRPRSRSVGRLPVRRTTELKCILLPMQLIRVESKVHSRLRGRQARLRREPASVVAIGADVATNAAVVLMEVLPHRMPRRLLLRSSAGRNRVMRRL